MSEIRASLSYWNMLTERSEFNEEQRALTFIDLLAHYEEPHRQYHNLPHINQCLLEKDKCAHLLFDEKAVELALWYHDAVYDLGEDNENKSAEMFFSRWSANCSNKTLINRVYSLILATGYGGTSDEIDTPYVIDIDHSILGQPENVFDEYEVAIRREYAIVPDEDFREGRLSILESFYNRPRIFKTDFFWGIYEFRARDNLSRSIAKLKSTL